MTLQQVKNTSYFNRENHTDYNREKYLDAGFAGITHALSTLATVICVAAFFPGFFALIYNLPEARGNEEYVMSIPFIILCIICTVGSCMLPDLDNTKSRAESSLGIIGTGLSSVFRASASFIQTTFRMKRDDKTPDPHRGFWHSPMGAILLAAPLYFIGSQASTSNNTNIANIVLIATVFILSYLSICTLMHKDLKRAAKKNAFASLFPYLFAAGVVGLMFLTNGIEIFSYAWPIAASVFFGMLLHTFGDCHTTSGAPIFAPFTAFTKKKVWWSTSFFAIKSGGDFEMNVLTKVYGLAATIGLIFLIVSYL